MVLQSASIVFNDSASQFNKDLTDFLRRNIETAVRKGGITFQFKIAKPSDLAGLRRKGIKRLPAMTIGKNYYIGVPDIIGEIRKRVKTSRHEAAVKTEEEIVRDYQMSALGDIKKDAEGKFVINEEPEKDDSESLMSAFNRELQRRGAAAGHGNPDEDDEDRNRRQRPARPSRDVENDLEEEEEEERPRKRRPAARRDMPQQPRSDNLDNPGMAEAMDSLRRIGRHATGDDAQDDAMMATLLGRMGGGD